MCNRLQTIVLMLQFCSWHRLGLYILWTVNDACPGTFNQLFQIDVTKAVINTVPFIKIFDNSATSHWKACMANTNNKIGWLHAQTNVQDGIRYIFNKYKDLSRSGPHANLINQLLPHIEGCEMGKMWDCIGIQPDILESAKKYLKDCEEIAGGEAGPHIAVHVRRGDYKLFNHDKIVNDPTTAPARQLAVQTLWSEADAKVEATAIKSATQSHNKCRNQLN